MSKTLRVCLAMGGGVSLGSYSGAGLTEALKLLLLFGTDKEEKPYDEIIVDGMSGASAGAISLGILLRCLVDYESMMQMAGYDSKAAILNRLNEEYDNPDIENFSIAKKEALYAIEVAQKIQHLIWVEKVTAEGLYGDKSKASYQMNMNEPFGILERKSLEKLAKQLILPNENFNSSRAALLDPNRILFALSLTNLVPMPVGYDNIGKDIREKNLLRSTASSNHAELRVIDFIFKENEEKPSDERWIKFLKNPTQPADNQMCYNLDKPNAWATLTASTLACGAFPIAFAPVVLKRFKKEYDSNIFETGATSKRKTTWPGGLLKIHDALKAQAEEAGFIKNSFFGEPNGNTLDYASFNFPYIDGGTFNNEPIKEAFKIASFQDFRRTTTQEDRLVLFVDPIVRKSEFKSFRINSYAAITSDYKTYDTTVKGELSKLFGLIDPLLGTLVDQGSIKEDQKINGVNQSLSLRTILFNYLDEFSVSFDEKLIVYAYEKINAFLDENMISIGTRDGHLYILEAIEKECQAAIKNDEKLAYLNDFKKDLSFLFETKENKDSDYLSQARRPNALYLNTLSELKKEFKDDKVAKYNELITRAVFKVLADLALGTAGKNEVIDKRVILPVTSNGQKIVDLPGHNVAAFAGFASRKSKEYAFEYARLNAAMTLAISDGQEGTDAHVQHAYLKKSIADDLKIKSIARLHATGFYHPDSTYSEDLKRDLISPGIDRFFAILKSFSSKLKKPKIALLGILGLVASLLGFFKKILNWLKKEAKERANTLADDTNYEFLKPISISIRSTQPIKLEKKGKIRIYTKSDFDLKVFQSADKKELLFSVYLMKTLNEQNETTAVALTAASKIKLPAVGLDQKAVDPNVDPKRWAEALEAASPPKIKSFQLRKKGAKIEMDFLNDNKQSLYYSLLHSQFHINPMLQFQLETKTWSFVENTQSFDKKMLEKANTALVS